MKILKATWSYWLASADQISLSILSGNSSTFQRLSATATADPSNKLDAVRTEPSYCRSFTFHTITAQGFPKPETC